MYPWLKYGHFVGIGVLVVGMGLHVTAVERLWTDEGVARFRELLVLARVGVRLVLVGGFVLVVFGVTMALQAWSLFDGWILSALGLVAAQGVMGSAVSERQLAVLEETIGDSTPGGRVEPAQPSGMLDGTGAWSLRAAGRASIANLLALELLMTLKPSGPELVTVLAVAILVAGALAASARRPRPVGAAH